MFRVLTVEKVGDRDVIVLSNEDLEFLDVKVGDRVSVSKQATAAEQDPEFDRQMKIVAEGMKRYDNALRKLAE